jgi:hypothetical protein
MGRGTPPRPHRGPSHPRGRARTPRPPRTPHPHSRAGPGLPWHLNLAAYNNGVATGTISHMRITMAGPSCDAVIDGTGANVSDGHVRFRYTDATGQLTVLTAGSGLRFFDVLGCAVLNDGDPVTIGATFAVTPKQAITSP